MKKTLFTIVFTVFCALMPVLMAKAVAQEVDSAVSNVVDTSEVERNLNEFDVDNSQDASDRLSDYKKDHKGEAMVDVFNDGHIRFGAGNLGFPEMIIALAAICLSLGLPVLILLVVVIFAQKKRRQMMELAGMYIKADQPMPEHVLAEFGSGMTADKRLRTGIQFLLVGIALTAILGTYADEAATFGLIPIAIGLARIIYWRYERKQDNDPQSALPDLTDD